MQGDVYVYNSGILHLWKFTVLEVYSYAPVLAFCNSCNVLFCDTGKCSGLRNATSDVLVLLLFCHISLMKEQKETGDRMTVDFNVSEKRGTKLHFVQKYDVSDFNK